MLNISKPVKSVQQKARIKSDSQEIRNRSDKEPPLTVFVTLYNVADYLPRFFRCMERQTYKNYILLIIDDGSEDNTLEICSSYAQKDPRIHVIHLSHIGVSGARNYAISMIRTPYAASVDGDDVYEPDYLKHLVDAREKYDADLAISRVVYRDEKYVKTGEIKASGERYISRDQFEEELPVLLKDRRLNYLYAKLFRSDILQKTHVEDDVRHGSDTMFCCQYVTMANSIVLIDDPDTNYIKYSSRSVTSHHDKDEFKRHCRIQNVITEIFKSSGFLNDRMQQAIDGRVMHSAMWVLSLIAKGNDPVNEALMRVHDIFRSSTYLEAYSRQKENLDAYPFSVVDPENIIEPGSQTPPRIIVSMTSFPAGIRNVEKVLETIYAQTRKADEVILWLAADQFPTREVPQRLTEYVNEGKLVIRWCDDLKQHKKYFHAFQEFVNDLIITIDDDILFSPTMIEDLYRSWLVHPRAVSAMRAHLMLLENGQLLPYNDWLMEYSLHIGEESMLLFAAAGAGTLFPAWRFNMNLLNADAIMQTCPYADDIWLKLMEIEEDIPVVLAKRYSGLNYLPGSQEQGLFLQQNRDHYDEQLKAAMEWYDRHYGSGFILKKLTGYHDKLGNIGSISEFYKAKIDQKQAEIKKKDSEIKAKNAAIEQQKRETARLRTELRKIWNSRSLKIGRIITWPGRVIKDHMKK